MKLYNNNEPEFLTIILQYLTSKFTIHHVYGHQDDNTETDKLSTYVKLNIDVDEIVTHSFTILINTHVSSMSFTVYTPKSINIHNDNLMQTKQGFS